ncbi:hypothetical protein G6F65_018861 [Rhizopus arrhizus]|nr:hypothetical protein G6F65_018861 [Rhizopus arrhizus]
MKRASFQRPAFNATTQRDSGRQLEAHVHAPLVGFTQPFRAAVQAAEMVFTAFLTPFLGRIGETLMSQVRMRRNARQPRVNALASQAHNAH